MNLVLELWYSSEYSVAPLGFWSGASLSTPWGEGCNKGGVLTLLYLA